MTTETKSTLQPPPNAPRVATGFAGDEIEDLAARIAGLSKDDAAALAGYVEREVAPDKESEVGK